MMTIIQKKIRRWYFYWYNRNISEELSTLCLHVYICNGTMNLCRLFRANSLWISFSNVNVNINYYFPQFAVNFAFEFLNQFYRRILLIFLLDAFSHIWERECIYIIVRRVGWWENIKFQITKKIVLILRKRKRINETLSNIHIWKISNERDTT